ncbi:hypothetical protein EMIT0P12_30176 [Pseudomonas sp. IT-P12]
MRPMKDRPVYGISYYGIPNFVQAFCLTGYLLVRFFIFDLYCLSNTPLPLVGAGLLANAVCQ